MTEMSPLRRRMIDDMTVRNLSPATQRSYVHAVAKFARFFGRSPEKLDLEDVRAFQVHLVAGGMSWPALNRTVCALRFLYGVTLRQADLPERIAYAREPQKLPVVLSTEEVVRFLEAVPSLKCRAALTTTYAGGLRASEVASLKVADIDSSRMVIRVQQGKGGRDRYVMLSSQLLGILRAYWRLTRPPHWLFPRQDGEHPIHPTTLNAACHSACVAAGLGKRVTVHTLRHSFATHLLESGTDIRIIQALLGHRNVNTTARYAQVATSTIGGVWDSGPLEAALLKKADGLVGDEAGFLVIDDTTLPKKGSHSVGVAPQYASSLGKTANCQSLVSVTLASREVPVMVGLRLFLPESWTDDPERMTRAHVPKDRQTALTKPGIAIEEIDRVIASGVRFGCVLADSGYGSSGPFRQALSRRGLRWAVGLSRRQTVYPADIALIFPVAKVGKHRKYHVPVSRCRLEGSSSLSVQASGPRPIKLLKPLPNMVSWHSRSVAVMEMTRRRQFYKRRKGLGPDLPFSLHRE